MKLNHFNDRLFLKLMSSTLGLMVFFLTLIGCDQSIKPQGHILSPTIKQLSDITFYQNKNVYTQYFTAHYTKEISNNNYIAAQQMLGAYAEVAQNAFDSVFVHYASDFLLKNYPIQHDSQYAMICNIVSWSYFLDTKYPLALEWGYRNLQLCDFPNAENCKRYAYLNLASVHVNSNRIDSAIYYFTECKRMDETKNLKAAVAVDDFNIGSCYYALHAYKECKIYVEKAANGYLAAKDSSEWLHTLVFIPYNADQFQLSEDSTLSKISFITAAYNQLATKSYKDSFMQHIMLCLEQVILKNYEKASSFLMVSESIKNRYKDYELITYIRLMKAKVDLGRNSNLESIRIYKEYANKLAGKNLIYEATYMYNRFSIIAYKNGNFKESIEYKLIEDSLNELANGNNKKGQLYEFEIKFETQKKEQQLTIKEAQIQKSKFYVTTLLFILSGIILSTLVLLTYRKRKEAQAEIVRQQKFTDELLQNTEDERKRIATDLHDGVNHELLTLKNQTELGKTVESEDIDKVINEVRQVSRDLYPAMFDTIGLAASIETLCERMNEAGLFTTCEINYTIKLSKRNELQLYRIIQEALNNTIKHAKANAAKVTIASIENELLVEIKDNGVGFDAEDKMNNSSSFGLQSLMQRTRAIGGELTIESNETGTKLILKTPIH